MRASQIEVGGVYSAKVNGGLTQVKVDAIRNRRSDSRTVYDVTNLKTGRKITFESAAKFRVEIKEQKNVIKREQSNSVGSSKGRNSEDRPVNRDSVGSEAGSSEETRQSDAPSHPGVRQDQSTGSVVPVAKSHLGGLAAKLQQRQSDSVHPHLIIEARAGTGKTTTLIEGLKVMKGLPSRITPSPQQQAIWDQLRLSADAKTICFVAFNKSIATELQERVPAGCEAMTMHSMGFKACQRQFGRLEPNSYVVQDIISEITEVDIRKLRYDQPVLLKATEELVGLCKQNLIGDSFSDSSYWWEELDKLTSHYDVDLNGSRSQVYDLVPKVLERCKQPVGKISFDDMIWLPVVLNLPMVKYDLLLVDECLPSWTPVMMDNGSSKEIKDVQVGDRVRSYNTTTGRAMNCSVTAVQKLPNKKPLLKIKVKHNHKTAGNRKSNFVVCTVDHKIWTVNRGWVQAQEVQLGDSVIIETAAKTTQRGKIAGQGRDKLSTLHIGNEKGLGNTGGTKENFNRIKGGNGRGLTTPQRVLLDALGEGWEAEFSVSTGGRGHGYPTCYKIDIANPESMVAIELDGNSHVNAEEIDNRKDAFLESRGWKVIRLKNREVARDLDGCVQQAICIDGKHCPMVATVESIDPTYITEHHVYDITVDVCHAFYANGILVHNCQDLNRCQQALAKIAGKRLILCGDPKQAIYGFAGADSQSMARMQEELSATSRCHEDNCIVLPLNVTRRCGKAIVAEANKIVPDFKAHESNPEGKISKAVMKSETGPTYQAQVNDGDFILCRTNAPLIQQCFRFIKAGRKANIQGRDVAAGLIKTVNKVCKNSGYASDLLTPVNSFVGKLSDWLHAEQQKENAKRFPNESKLITLQDRHDCLLCFTEGSQTVAQVVEKINTIFTDDKTSAGIKLSSIHKSKGLESKRVFFLKPKGSNYPTKSEWEANESRNLEYVAITRAIEELIYVYEE